MKKLLAVSAGPLSTALYGRLTRMEPLAVANSATTAARQMFPFSMNGAMLTVSIGTLKRAP
jgi:hypothetical protein